MLKKIAISIGILLTALVVLYVLLIQRQEPETIQYGVSFNTLYARELGLDWQETYDAVLDDLGVRHLRLAAHWDLVEPEDDQWNFVELDYQIARAEEVGAEVVFAVGRRLPRWPECHEPLWAEELDWEVRQEEIKEYIDVVVNRYKESPAITYWQVENEPFLEVFATEHCGELDVDFLEEEIALVQSLDDTRPILLTDSGNLGTWFGPYRRGDVFGTSVYVYLWNPDIGPFKSFLPAHFYRFKTGLMQLLFGKKEVMLIELSLEPWLLEPIVDATLAEQLERMNIEKMRDILAFAKATHLEKQYLWGAEWWYYLKERGEADFWNEGKKLFK